MTREESKAFYPILQAYAEGKVIECRTKPNAVEGTDIPNDWTEMKEIEFWKKYRVPNQARTKVPSIQGCRRVLGRNAQSPAFWVGSW